MIKVLIVEDSVASAQLLAYILESDSDICIQGIAISGEAALKMIEIEKPDVITMDIALPGIDGLSTTRAIMEKTPIPIIVVSGSYSENEVSLAFKAIEAGALYIIEKPYAIKHPLYEAHNKELLTLVKLISEIKVVKRNKIESKLTESMANSQLKIKNTSKFEIIAIGASTGGPQVLQAILSRLKGADLPPVLIVQHISKGFSRGFADWLTETTKYPVMIATNGEIAKRGVAYIAPDNIHLGIDPKGKLIYNFSEEIHCVRPAVSYLFASVAKSFCNRAIGVLLTGMGEDGAKELKLMRDKGAVTFAQNSESSVVFGMPNEAIKISAADYINSPEWIAQKILELTNN